MNQRARQLPLLANLRIASPCDAKWEDMRGDDRVRFCGACTKNVYDLSAMTAGEAETFLTATEGRACVRYSVRVDGTVISADCPVGQRQTLRKRVALGVASAFAALVQACAGGAGVLEETASVQGDPAVPVAVAPTKLGEVGVATMGEPTMGKPSATPTPSATTPTPIPTVNKGPTPEVHRTLMGAPPMPPPSASGPKPMGKPAVNRAGL